MIDGAVMQVVLGEFVYFNTMECHFMRAFIVGYRPLIRLLGHLYP